MTIKYKKEYFFKKYGYPDMDNTYWETQEYRDTYNLEEELELPLSVITEADTNPVDPKYFGKVCNIS